MERKGLVNLLDISREEFYTGNYWMTKSGSKIYKISDMSDAHLTNCIHLLEREMSLRKLDDIHYTVHFNMNIEYLKRGLNDLKKAKERFEETSIKDQNQINKIINMMKTERRR